MKKMKKITRYGFSYTIDRIMVGLKIKSRLSNRALLARQSFFEKMDPAMYENELSNWYLQNTHNHLNLEKPERFTEKLQWLKLYDSTEQKGILADKYLVREWVTERIGSEYLIPLLGVWDTPEQLDYSTLPKSFVLKCNHGAKMNIIVPDISRLDTRKTNKQLAFWLRQNQAFFDGSFQLHYNFIKPRIIAEQFMKDESSDELRDYKFFCFDGTPSYCQVISDRSQEETVDFYDMNWTHQEVTGLSCHKNSPSEITKPRSFDMMLTIVKKLAKGFPFVRVDLYEINGKPYFGEMTFTPASGAGNFRPDSFDFELGRLLRLPEKKDQNEKIHIDYI